MYKLWCLKLASVPQPIPSSVFFMLTSSRTWETKASDRKTVPMIWCCSRDISHCMAKSTYRDPWGRLGTTVSSPDFAISLSIWVHLFGGPSNIRGSIQHRLTSWVFPAGSTGAMSSVGMRPVSRDAGGFNQCFPRPPSEQYLWLSHLRLTTKQRPHILCPTTIAPQCLVPKL